jgi:hypothetical protein
MPERIQRKRTKGWRMPAGAVYVGRPTIWGNPWAAGTPHGALHLSDIILLLGPYSARDCAGQFQAWLDGYEIVPKKAIPANLTRRGRCVVRDELSVRRSTIIRRLPELRGHNLACWCPLDSPCHADMLLELANR